MKRMILKTESVPPGRVLETLREHGIQINAYAETFMSHPRFLTSAGETRTIVIAELREIGLERGGTLGGIFARLPETGLKPCPADTGLFLRMMWRDQQKSRNDVLSGTHQAPDMAVTVLSEMLEADDSFPKGLYLRNVGGSLWLRGYVCDAVYRFPGDSLFAFEGEE
ncbi:MAG: helicase [Clostridia bacterium]|nr:helicase [Clostridia bacterium]